MAVNDILDIGRQGLTTHQRALQTTASNIANANTPGYTRRKAVIETVPGTVSNGVQIGGGVEVTKVVRIHDEFVEKQLVDESHSLGGAKAKSEGLLRAENMVARDGQALGELINKFYSDVRDLSVNPETSTLRNIVSSSARAVADGFRNMNDGIETLQREIDLRIGDTLSQVNSATKQIASLNEAIQQAEARGDTPNELYDKRDLAVRNLAQKINFNTTTDQLGQVSVICSGTVLVQGNESHSLYALKTPETDQKGPGGLDIFVSTKGGGRAITGQVNDGELGGMLYVRDGVLNPARTHLDSIAYQMATSVNGLHRQGVGLDGQGGRDLFREPLEVKGAANAFDLSDDIRVNHEAIASGFAADSPGDNRLAIQIADLQNEKGIPAMNLGASEGHTVNESLNSLVGDVGIHAQRENSFMTQQRAVVEQLENYRESFSGVSLEEEAVNMIQYQTVFNASAKAMKVGEELFETILSLKR